MSPAPSDSNQRASVRRLMIGPPIRKSPKRAGKKSERRLNFGRVKFTPEPEEGLRARGRAGGGASPSASSAPGAAGVSSPRRRRSSSSRKSLNGSVTSSPPVLRCHYGLLATSTARANASSAACATFDSVIVATLSESHLAATRRARGRRHGSRGSAASPTSRTLRQERPSSTARRSPRPFVIKTP